MFGEEQPVSWIDHLVGAEQQGLWKLQTQGLRSGEVHDEIESRGSFDWNVSRPRPFEEPSRHDAKTAEHLHLTGPVRDQTSGHGEFPEQRDRRETALDRELGETPSVA